jgi:hypothetical protein
MVAGVGQNVQRGATNATSASVFPELDQRFARFSGFRQESTSYVTLAYGHAGKPKVLWYDICALVQKGAFRTALVSKGTIFNVDHTIIVDLTMYAFVASLAFCAVYFFPNFAEFESSKLEVMSDYLNRFIPFILGLYVTLSLERWWTVRTEGIGQVLNSCQNIALITAAMFPGSEFGHYQDQLVKYGLASVSLIVNMCRQGGQDRAIDVLGPSRDNLLTAREIDVLSTIPYRAQAAVMWTWIMVLAEKVMEEQAISPSKQRDIIAEVVKARNGIEKIITYMQSQLPFAYVHLVTLLVNMNNMIMALKCGMVMARQLKQENYMYAGCQLVFLFSVPLLYQGLLSVSYVIHDPFGEDLLDFPVMAYQEYANEASVAIAHFTYCCPALSKTWGSDSCRATLTRDIGKGATLDTAAKQAYQRSRHKEEEASIIKQMQEQDDTIARLRQQNSIAASHVQSLNGKAMELEARISKMLTLSGMAS